MNYYWTFIFFGKTQLNCYYYVIIQKTNRSISE